MAARKRLKLKLKYGSRVQTSEASKSGPHTKEDTMEMRSDHIMQSPEADAHGPLLSPLAQNNTMISHEPMAYPPALVTSVRRRRPSKPTSPSAIRRSASTPNVRRLAAADAGMSMADKRRNKLGYHRTSVACGHCRRRKIRCLLAPDDPQSRCSNCIRLKKECNFFPVDQQPQVERRPRTGSRAEARSGETSISSSSSPGITGGHVIEQVDHFNHYPPLQLATHGYPGSMAPLSASVLSPPASAAPVSSRVFEFPHHDDRPQWTSPFYDHGPVSAGHVTSEDSSSSYWKLAESPMTPAFSPYSSVPPNSLAPQPRDANGGYVPFNGQRQEAGWPVPTRSMSFGHAEALSHQYDNSYHQPYQLDYRRRASDLHPPSLLNSANSSNTSMSDAPNPPLSAPIPSQPMHHLLPPAWNSLPGLPPTSKAPDFNTWYQDPGQLTKVQEEEPGPHFGSNSAILYSGAGHR